MGREMYYKIPNSSRESYYPMCDLVMEFDDHAHLVEVKSIHGNLYKAERQLSFGRQWFHNYRNRLWEPHLTIVKYDIVGKKEMDIVIDRLWRPIHN